MSKPENKNPLANLSPAQIEALLSLADQEAARLAKIRAEEAAAARMKADAEAYAAENRRRTEEYKAKLRAAAAKIPAWVFSIRDHDERRLLILHPEKAEEMPRPMTDAEIDQIVARRANDPQWRRLIEQKGPLTARATIPAAREREREKFFAGLLAEERALERADLDKIAKENGGFVPDAIHMTHEVNFHAGRARRAMAILDIAKEEGIGMPAPVTMPVDVEGLRAGAARVL